MSLRRRSGTPWSKNAHTPAGVKSLRASRFRRPHRVAYTPPVNVPFAFRSSKADAMIFRLMKLSPSMSTGFKGPSFLYVRDDLAQPRMVILYLTQNPVALDTKQT